MIIYMASQLKESYQCRINDPFRGQHRLCAQRKLEKYQDLREQCFKNVKSTHIFPLEIRCRGFISNSTSIFLSKLGLAPAETREYIKKVPKQDCNCI